MDDTMEENPSGVVTRTWKRINGKNGRTRRPEVRESCKTIKEAQEMLNRILVK
jgi:hypothetical protein